MFAYKMNENLINKFNFFQNIIYLIYNLKLFYNNLKLIKIKLN